MIPPLRSSLGSLLQLPPPANMSAASSASSAAVAELALDRERAAMSAADAQSFVAQRYYVRSMQLPRLNAALADRDYTWQSAYNDRHNHWLAALDAMRAARTANRAGDAQSVHEALEEQLGSDSEADSEADQDAPQLPALMMLVQQEMERSRLQPSPGTTQSPGMFTGTAHRLG